MPVQHFLADNLNTPTDHDRIGAPGQLWRPDLAPWHCGHPLPPPILRLVCPQAVGGEPIEKRMPVMASGWSVRGVLRHFRFQQ
jgi:hypothetical protein